MNKKFLYGIFGMVLLNIPLMQRSENAQNYTTFSSDKTKIEQLDREIAKQERMLRTARLTKSALQRKKTFLDNLYKERDSLRIRLSIAE